LYKPVEKEYDNVEVKVEKGSIPKDLAGPQKMALAPKQDT